MHTISIIHETSYSEIMLNIEILRSILRLFHKTPNREWLRTPRCVMYPLTCLFAARGVNCQYCPNTLPVDRLCFMVVEEVTALSLCNIGDYSLPSPSEHIRVPPGDACVLHDLISNISEFLFR